MNSSEVPVSLSRSALLRRLLVFQVKLLLDGLRDLFLSPVSIFAVLVGLLFGGDRPDRPFRQLMSFGRRTDIWIDLFDLHRPEPWSQTRPQAGLQPSSPEQVADAPGQAAHPAGTSAETVIDTVERILREEYARGGSREAIDARLARLREAARSALQAPDRDQGPGAESGR